MRSQQTWLLLTNEIQTQTHQGHQETIFEWRGREILFYYHGDRLLLLYPQSLSFVMNVLLTLLLYIFV